MIQKDENDFTSLQDTKKTDKRQRNRRSAWWIYFPSNFPLTFKWEASFSIVSLGQSPQSSDCANCACDHFFGAKVQCTAFEAVRWLLLCQKVEFFWASTWYFDISHSVSWETKNRRYCIHLSEQGCMRGFHVKDQGNVSFRVWLWLVWHREVFWTLDTDQDIFETWPEISDRQTNIQQQWS